MSETAAPPQAPVSTGSTDVLAGMSAEQRQSWRLTGTLPSAPSDSASPPSDSESSLSTAESTPAEPVEQAASTDAPHPPASEPGTPKKANADTRKAELKAEIEGLLKQRRELQELIARESALRPSPGSDGTAASSPAPAGQTLAQVVDAPDLSAPALSDSDFFARFPDAQAADYYAYRARYEVLRERQVWERGQAQQSLKTRFAERMAETIQADPAFWSKQDPRVIALKPLDLLEPGERATPLHYAAQEIVTLAHPARVIAHLTAHPELLESIQHGTPAGAIRTIARLDATLATPSATPESSAGPSGPPVSLAPPPPATLGKKPAQPVDELTEAIRRGDFTRYRELQNRQEMKRA